MGLRPRRCNLRSSSQTVVDWVEDADSRVDLMATSLENLQGVWRLATDRWIQSVSARPRPV
jgi:hypothetical protein